MKIQCMPKPFIIYYDLKHEGEAFFGLTLIPVLSYIYGIMLGYLALFFFVV